MGYPLPDGYHYPMDDPSISLEEGMRILPLWVTSYYGHGDTLETLSLHDSLIEPTPTVVRMSPEDLTLAFHQPPSLHDWTDPIILRSGIRRGVFSRLREAALFARDNAEVAWPNVEFRYVWCDHSVWLMPWGIWSFHAELEQARKSRKGVRTHSAVRMRGANHCVCIIFHTTPL